MRADLRYSASPDADGGWVVIDQEREDRAVANCAEASGAALVAALMNGDLAILAKASAEALAYCHSAVDCALRPLRPRGRPAVGMALFPQV
jgi:hypothetical protein